ncbi:MAG: hypothetical protein QG657_5059, partial [Acidobacteriota bacterium]|nr:hypothetical protein [Acidobacteriota bacterium]
MKKSKKLFLFLFVFVLWFSILFSDDITATGLGRIKITGKEEVELGKKTEYDKLTEVCPDLDKWVKDASEGKDINKKQFMKKLDETIKNCWNEASDSIMNNPDLSQEFKNKFSEKLNNKDDQGSLVFSERQDHGANWGKEIGIPINSEIKDKVWDEASQKWVDRTTEDCYLKKIVDFIAAKLAKGDLDMSDFKNELINFIATLIHEMMHYFGNVNQTLDEWTKSENRRRYECIAECMTYLLTGIAGDDLKNCDNHCAYLHRKCLDAAGCKTDKKNHKNMEKYWSDWPDDNYSYSDGNLLFTDITNFSTGIDVANNNRLSFLYSPDALIYSNFEKNEMEYLLDRFSPDQYFFDYVHDYFSNKHKVLVIPTGELSGDENSEIIRQAVSVFVENGGTLIVFSQQYDSNIEKLAPSPAGEHLKAYGWRQDSSCLKNSIYFESIHPVLSSSTNELIDAGVDGYFSVYPSNSTILLKRKINLEPAMLYYPYGNGTVILTSMFTDWAYAHSQSTS